GDDALLLRGPHPELDLRRLASLDGVEPVQLAPLGVRTRGAHFALPPRSRERVGEPAADAIGGAPRLRAAPRAQRGRAPARAPVRIISSALPLPMSRGRRCVPPPPGMIARLTSVRPSVAFSAAMRMSHASASSRPPPSAKPLIAAMIGCAQRSIIARYSIRL